MHPGPCVDFPFARPVQVGWSEPATTARGMSKQTPAPWLTLRELAAELNVSYETVRKWRAGGTLPPCTKLPNRQLRVHREDLDLWLEARLV